MAERRQILIIDNIDVNRVLIKKVLESGPYIFLEAENCKTGWSMLEKNRNISLILMGLNREDRESWDFLEGKEIPIIVCLDKGQEDLELEVLKAGAFDCILRPFKPGVFAQRIKKIIEFTAESGERAVFSNSGEEMKRLVENLPVGIGVYEIGQEIYPSYINQQAIDLFGFSQGAKEKLQAMDNSEFVNIDASVLEAMRKSGEEMIMDHVDKAYRENGDPFWMKSVAKIIPNSDGSLECYTIMQDVTEAEKIKIELKNANQKIGGIISNLPGAVVAFEVNDGNICLTYTSENCVKVIGYTAEEALARYQQDALIDIHVEDRNLLKDIFYRNTEEWESASYTFRMRGKNGNYRWVALNLSPVLIDDKMTFYGVFTDVNDEKEKSTMLAHLVNALPGGVAIYRIGKTVETLYSSDGVPRLSGRTMAEYKEWVKGDILGNVVFEDDLPEVRQAVYDAVSKNESLNITYRIEHKNGELIWIQLTANKIKEENGAKIYYAIYTKPTEEAALYQSLIEDATVAVLVMEKATDKILYANGAWRKIEDIPQEQIIIGRRINDVVPERQVVIPSEEKDLLNTEGYREMHKIRQDGTCLLINGRMVQWNGIDSYIFYISDETREYNQRQQLQTLIDKVPGGVAIYEIIDGKISLNYINNSYYQMVGFRRGERENYLGFNTLNAVHPDDRTLMASAVMRLSEGDDYVDVNYRAQTSRGDYIWVRLIGSVVERKSEKILLYASFSDVNSLINTQRELQSNRAMLDAAMENAHVIAWKLDVKKHCLVQTEQAMNRDGMEKRIENVPDSLIEAGLIHPDSVENYKKLYEEIYAGRTAKTDFRARYTPDTPYAWFRFIYTPVYNSKGKFVEAIGTSMDITEQKDREQAYEEQLNLKKALARNALATLSINLSQDRISEVESGNEELMKLVSSDSATDFYHSVIEQIDDIEEKERCSKILSSEAILDAYNRGETHIAVRHHLSLLTGWVETSCDIIANPYSGDIEAFAILKDINEEVRAEEVIDTLVSTDYDSILTLDAESGEILPFLHTDLDPLFKNNSVGNGEISGVEAFLRANSIDVDIERVVKENNFLYIKECLKKTSLYTTTYSLNITGKIVHKRAIYTYLNGDKKTLLCAVQDLTEAYEQDEKQKRQLEAALLEAKNASGAKTEFLSNMSHEIRTPMNAIIGMVNLAEGVDGNPEETKNYLEKIDASSNYLLGLLNDVLDMSRIESGKLELHPEWMRVEGIFTPCINMMLPVMEQKHIHFIYPDLEKVNNIEYYVDPLRTKQILMNLLNNAAKFTPAGGTVTLGVKNIYHDDTKSIDRLTIRDTGYGMSEDFLKRIFQPFEQERIYYAEPVQGTGLGLTLVKHIISAMGGDISVESELGRGSTFSLTFPYLYRIREKGEEEKQKVISQASLGGKHILLVDDHPLNREIARKLLEKQNALVDIASDGKEAVNKFAASPMDFYDGILMDIRMPVMDGLEATRIIRKTDRPDAKDVPIIAMTANAFDDDMQSCLDAGMNDHLSKPTEPQILYDTLIKYFSLRAEKKR
ncbi:MAG: PAS domain S-box protein [Clostridia bacterium]|nr:PAS domain S-box protein [Clostridia bacterium]